MKISLPNRLMVVLLSLGLILLLAIALLLTNRPKSLLATGVEIPAIQGNIIHINPNNAVFVEGERYGTKSTLVANIDDQTNIFIQTNEGKVETVRPTNLSKGMVVKVLCRGMILQSSPEICTAREILILP